MLSHVAPPPIPGPWAEMWARAATGPDGYWRTHEVPDGFRTAPATGTGLAEAVVGLLAGCPGVGRVVDVGAGEGELLAAVGRLRPDLEVVGVDLRPGPPADGVRWVQDRWSGDRSDANGWIEGRLPALLRQSRTPTLLIAHEWLDDLPVTVLASDPRPGADRPAGLRTVMVDRAGMEQEGAPADPADLAWASRWWPPDPGSRASRRVEVGRRRDRAWAGLVGLLAGSGGLALMVDYGHDQATRPVGGSLRGYAAGRMVRPVPDGRCNLTCDVAVDAVRAAGERAGAVTVADLRQHEAIDRWRPAGPGRPRPLDRLATRSATQALRSPTGFGRYRWLLQRRAAERSR